MPFTPLKLDNAQRRTRFLFIYCYTQHLYSQSRSYMSIFPSGIRSLTKVCNSILYKTLVIIILELNPSNFSRYKAFFMFPGEEKGIISSPEHKFELHYHIQGFKIEMSAKDWIVWTNQLMNFDNSFFTQQIICDSFVLKHFEACIYLF